jgi:hypothetical protein
LDREPLPFSIDVCDSARNTILSIISVATVAASITISISVVAVAVTFVPVAVGPFPLYLIAATFEPIFEIVEQVTIRRKTL